MDDRKIDLRYAIACGVEFGQALQSVKDDMEHVWGSTTYPDVAPYAERLVRDCRRLVRCAESLRRSLTK